MSNQNVYKKSRREQVYDRLYDAVTAADSYQGKRLAPVKALAEQFGTSVRTVQLAMEQLENEGFIQRRHGVGTFVARQTPALAATDQVVVAMPAHHEVWRILAARIARELHASGRIPVSIDTNHSGAAALLHRAARANVGTFIIRGGRGFPFALLKEPAFRDKQIIAVEEWASTVIPARMHQILHDYAYGGQQLAEYLMNRGHRRVVIVAAADSLKRLTQRDGLVCGASRGHAFIDYWTGRGGTWTSVTSVRDDQALSSTAIQEGHLLRELTEPAKGEPATAVFGYRDVEAWTAQNLLRRRRPDLLDQIDIVGYGDTLWSRAALPALTSIAYPVDDMALWVRQLFETELSGGGSGRSKGIMVRPQLVDRSNHFSRRRHTQERSDSERVG